MPPQLQNQKSYTWTAITIALILGSIMIFTVCVFAEQKSFTINFISAFGSGVLIAGASLSAGGFLGFIFGIPSIMQAPGARVKYNDNLGQISDWLTKIIVGVGLTQLTKIPGKILQLGEVLKYSFADSPWGRNIALSITAYFFLLGFLMIYFWAKTDYSTILDEMDKQLQQKIEEEQKKREIAEQNLEEKTKEQQQTQSELKQMASDFSREKIQQNISQSPDISDSQTVNDLLAGSSDSIKTDLEQLEAKVKTVLPLKPITVPDDLQKNRWGELAERNGKKIAATVTQNQLQSLYDVVITIAMLDGAPIMPVAIFVHDTFQLPDNIIFAKPDPENSSQVKLSLLAYEAFTIGALLADGTELELDLNQQPGYPSSFYWK